MISCIHRKILLRGRQGGREGGREGEREGGREGERSRQGGRERGREGGRERGHSGAYGCLVKKKLLMSGDRDCIHFLKK